jgi:alpha-tubulin suppressor-like RCC1 family protein
MCDLAPWQQELLSRNNSRNQELLSRNNSKNPQTKKIKSIPLSINKDQLLILNNGGQLLQINLRQTSQLSPIGISLPDKIISLSSEENTFGVVTENGSVYLWGSNHDLFDSQSPLTQPTQLILSKPALKIMVRKRGFAVILEDLSVYYHSITGSTEIPIQAIDISISGLVDELGIVTNGGELFKLTSTGHLDKIETPEHIKQISMGCGYRAALSTTGNIYLWGINHQGQLGFGHINRIISPTKLNLPDPIKFISCSEMITSAISQTGKLYIWGSNQHNRISKSEKIISFLKLREDKLVTSPLQIEIGSPIRYLIIGEEFTVALTEKGEINIWGGFRD